jgi:hypothetical protein
MIVRIWPILSRRKSFKKTSNLKPAFNGGGSGWSVAAWPFSRRDGGASPSRRPKRFAARAMHGKNRLASSGAHRVK